MRKQCNFESACHTDFLKKNRPYTVHHIITYHHIILKSYKTTSERLGGKKMHLDNLNGLEPHQMTNPLHQPGWTITIASSSRVGPVSSPSQPTPLPKRGLLPKSRHITTRKLGCLQSKKRQGLSFETISLQSAPIVYHVSRFCLQASLATLVQQSVVLPPKLSNACFFTDLMVF